ncbi:MAG TPA: hypothetical protein ENO27_03545 [Caldithrix sp.]|nr:hypothetical protein [Calditrichaceae bacterium]HEM49265.1 hypothetical protein [Caldithrix sp.]HES59040.1 hypothetical protein [Caldithrix sp.]
MDNKFFKIILIILFVFILITVQANAVELSGGVMVGYSGGTSFQLDGMIGQFAQGFPLKMQLALVYSRVNPGSAWDAREVFINDNQNGDPEKSGSKWDFRLDFLYQVHWLNLKELYIYGGPRYSMFTAHSDFVDGNEVFDIETDQWGWGLGAKADFPISRKLDFVVSTGMDYYLNSKISGHDTAYSPDGEGFNERDGYSYDDADDAIDQPKFQLRLLIGVNYHF